jgi:hypothetical protein
MRRVGRCELGFTAKRGIVTLRAVDSVSVVMTSKQFSTSEEFRAKRRNSSFDIEIAIFQRKQYIAKVY